MCKLDRVSSFFSAAHVISDDATGAYRCASDAPVNHFARSSSLGHRRGPPGGDE